MTQHTLHFLSHNFVSLVHSFLHSFSFSFLTLPLPPSYNSPLFRVNWTTIHIKLYVDQLEPITQHNIDQKYHFSSNIQVFHLNFSQYVPTQYPSTLSSLIFYFSRHFRLFLPISTLDVGLMCNILRSISNYMWITLIRPSNTTLIGNIQIFRFNPSRLFVFLCVSWLFDSLSPTFTYSHSPSSYSSTIYPPTNLSTRNIRIYRLDKNVE